MTAGISMMRMTRPEESPLLKVPAKEKAARPDWGGTALHDRR